MTTEDFHSAKDRLERAKKEAIWIIGVSNDLTIHMQEYNLTPEEKDALLLESRKHLAEIQKAIARERIEFIPPFSDHEFIPPFPDQPTRPGREDEEETKRGRAGGDKPAQQNEDRS